jgi:hypothetical protein
MRIGYVYFLLQVHDIERGLTKIGFASNPYSRAREIGCGNPYELELLGTFKGTQLTESRAHNLLASRRVRGEWFALGAAHDIVAQMFIDGEEKLEAVTENLAAAIAIEDEALDAEMESAGA